MSELSFPDFIIKIKHSKEPFWCVTTTTIKPFNLDDSRIIVVNDSVNFAKLKSFVDETASAMSGKFYPGSISIFFDNEYDINLLKIKYPEINR